MQNVLLSDIVDDPDREPACDFPSVKKEVEALTPYTYYQNRPRGFTPGAQRRAFERQFFSTPNTQTVNDQTGFAEWLYGKKFQPLCRDDPSQCDPNYWGAQTAAYAGLDPSDGPRGLRGGHGRGSGGL